jgi:hypothetical protein
MGATKARCPSENTLLELACGSLSATGDLRVREHVASCSVCASLVGLLFDAHPNSEESRPVTLAVREFRNSRSVALGGIEGATPGSEAYGARMGRYELLQFLGAGSMGVVYRAYDPALARVVAIKVLSPRPEGGFGSALCARILREARAMAKLRHPNVVAVYDVGAIESRAFLAMEYVPGRTLAAWRAEQKPSLREILSAFAAAGRGLAAAHDVGLVHRDFKPENVLVGDTGEVRVTDFGLARALDETFAPSPRGATGLANASLLTRSGAFAGTPAYMAPEQMCREPATIRSDIFSFCAALHEAMHGVRPFEGSTLLELRESVLAGRIRSSQARIPPRVRRAVARGLRVRPEERFETMQELLREIEGETRTRKPRAAMAVGGCVVLAVGAGLLGPWPAPSSRPARDLDVRTAAAPAATERGASGGDVASRVLSEDIIPRKQAQAPTASVSRLTPGPSASSRSAVLAFRPPGKGSPSAVVAPPIAGPSSRPQLCVRCHGQQALQARMFCGPVRGRASSPCVREDSSSWQ